MPGTPPNIPKRFFRHLRPLPGPHGNLELGAHVQEPGPGRVGGVQQGCRYFRIRSARSRIHLFALKNTNLGIQSKLSEYISEYSQNSQNTSRNTVTILRIREGPLRNTLKNTQISATLEKLIAISFQGLKMREEVRKAPPKTFFCVSFI